LFGQLSRGVGVLAWHDDKNVTMISTYHTDEVCVSVSRGKEIIKPVVMTHYNSLPHERG
jgi:hypothetical protein